MVQLSDDLLAQLDREAEHRGCSRSALVRRAVEEFLKRHSVAAMEEQWLAGYRLLPPGAIDEWGDLEAEADHSGHAIARALDAEEVEAGLSW